jgi:hypothetical protein
VSTPNSAKVGLGVTAFLAFVGVVVPVLANVLNPTLLLNALVAIALGAATAIVQRSLARRSQRRALAGALRLWPPTRVADADVAPLGVYPPYEHDHRPSPYVERPRHEDQAVREALNESDIVVLHGPAGAGKSRAASEAAARVLSQDVAFVPLNAGALRLIADRSIEMDLPKGRVCLWLDSAERFVEALDARALESLKQLAPHGVKVVATIRSQQWEELLVGTGQSSDAARALDAQATVLALGPRQ